MSSPSIQYAHKAATEAAVAASHAEAAVTSASSTLWDRASIWVAEHKAAVYTIAGITLVVTGAGVVYYAAGASEGADGIDKNGEPRKSKKERRKAKKEAEEAAAKAPAIPGDTPITNTAPTETPGKNPRRATRVHSIRTNCGAVEIKVPPPVATVETEDDLPSVDESTVGALSDQVG